ncbi:MAG: SCP2 sterol-binding domain-containing protein [Gammaproteobacteria bacterium]|nr:SCP2 sterol-binding domain-containing protein [Gammaproteobacteria bacterium]
MILIQQLLHSVLQPAVNKALRYDPYASAKLARLEQKSFAVKLTDLSIQIKLWVHNGELTFSANIESPDCYVETSTKYLKQLSDASQLTRLIKQDELLLEGDLAIAQGFSGLLLDNDIDWQQMLARYVGDATAHRIAHGIESLRQVIQTKQSDLDYTVSSALVDELKVTPSQFEVDEFIEQVDQLHARTEKLAAALKTFRG